MFAKGVWNALNILGVAGLLVAILIRMSQGYFINALVLVHKLSEIFYIMKNGRIIHKPSYMDQVLCKYVLISFFVIKH